MIILLMYGSYNVPKVPDIFRQKFPDNDPCVSLFFVASLLAWREKSSAISFVIQLLGGV